MGSLTPGWYSIINKDPKIVSFERNKSLTKEDIAAYWESKKTNKEEDSNEGSIKEEPAAAQVLQRSNSLPPTEKKESSMKIERPSYKDCWWTRSNWAFLNEPPVTAMEGPNYKYAAQYHVSNLSNSKISTV